MPSLEENIQTYTTYGWPKAGDEWSSPWGNTDYLWHGTIYPRIFPFLPVDHILEIAPGYGRCTQFLHRFCSRLTIVDIAENCIQHCKKRFKKQKHITYIVNDGKSLQDVKDRDVDFVFSWDSLVHVEEDVLENYFCEFSRVMASNTFGFIHHSNVGFYEKMGHQLENRQMRGKTVSAETVEKICKKSKLNCLAQELIAWGEDYFNDCFSVFTNDPRQQGNTLYKNYDFNQEISAIHNLYHHYNRFSRTNPE